MINFIKNVLQLSNGIKHSQNQTVPITSFPGVKKLVVYFGLLSILVFLGKGRPETDCSWEVNLLFNMQILNLMSLSVNLF